MDAVDAGIRNGEEHIGGHIQAHVLHGDQRATLGEGDAHAHFGGHFFVGRPLSPSAEVGKGFQDFGGRRAGVAGAEGDAGVQGRERDGFVAAEENRGVERDGAFGHGDEGQMFLCKRGRRLWQGETRLPRRWCGQGKGKRRFIEGMQGTKSFAGVRGGAPEVISIARRD